MGYYLHNYSTYMDIHEDAHSSIKNETRGEDIDIINIIPMKDFIFTGEKLIHTLTGENFFCCDTFVLSKTAKVIIKDGLECQSCSIKAEFLVVYYNNQNSGTKPYISFWYKSKYRHSYQLMTKDHIVPKAMKGSNSYNNLQCLCYDCNQSKGDYIPSNITDISKYQTILERNKNKGLFINKTEEWDEEVVQRKIKDFYYTRKRIKNAINKLPWYYRILGVGKYIEQELKEPLEEKGYYQNLSVEDFLKKNKNSISLSKNKRVR